MTCGILDAYVFGNALTRVLALGEPDGLLTECAESRRQTRLNSTNQLSTANLKRMRSMAAEDVAARQEFFDKLKGKGDFPSQFRKTMNSMLGKLFGEKIYQRTVKSKHRGSHIG